MGEAIRENVFRVCLVHFKFDFVGRIEAWTEHCTALKNKG